MKKRIHFHASDALMLVALVAMAALCSSFTVAIKNVDAATFSHSAWATLQNYSFHKLSFWQKAALAVGAFGASTYAVRRFNRYHPGGGLGCLGVLGALVLGILIIALLPVILVVGLVMLILGMPFHWDRGGRRGR